MGTTIAPNFAMWTRRFECATGVALFSLVAIKVGASICSTLGNRMPQGLGLALVNQLSRYGRVILTKASRHSCFVGHLMVSRFFTRHAHEFTPEER